MERNEEAAGKALGEDGDYVTYGGFIEVRDVQAAMEDVTHWFWLVESMKGLRTWFKMNLAEEPENIYFNEGEKLCMEVIEYMEKMRKKPGRPLMPFNEWLQAQLTDTGMSQGKLAVLADMQPAQISLYVQGKREPGIYNLARIVKAFGMELKAE